jgi:hypothetical protein
VAVEVAVGEAAVVMVAAVQCAAVAAVERGPAVVVEEIAVAAGDLAAAAWLAALPRCRDRAAAAVVGHRSTFRVAVVREWDDFRRRVPVQVDGLAAAKSRVPAAVRVRAVGRLRVPVVEPDLAADKLLDPVAAMRVREAVISRAADRRSGTSTTS